MLKEPFSSYDVGLDSSRRFERLNVQRFQHVSTLKLKGNHIWLSCFTSYRMAVAHPTITVALRRGYLMYLQLINLPTRRVPWHQGLRIKHQLKWQSNSAVFPLQNVICMEQIYNKYPSSREPSESELVFPEGRICSEYSMIGFVCRPYMLEGLSESYRQYPQTKSNQWRAGAYLPQMSHSQVALKMGHPKIPLKIGSWLILILNSHQNCEKMGGLVDRPYFHRRPAAIPTPRGRLMRCESFALTGPGLVSARPLLPAWRDVGTWRLQNPTMEVKKRIYVFF